MTKKVAGSGSGSIAGSSAGSGAGSGSTRSEDVRALTVGAMSSLVRLWWVPLLVGLLVGVGVGASTRSVTSSTTSAIVNTRAASNLPNERLDLVKDLSAVMALSPVLEPVAEANDLSVSELRSATTVNQVQSSSLGRVTVTSPEGEKFRRSLIRQLVDSGASYLSPPNPPPALVQAEKKQSQAIKAYYQAIADNDGLSPEDTLQRVQARLISARNAKNEILEKALLKQADRAVKKARKFEKLRLRLNRANTEVNAASASSRNVNQLSALEVSYEQNTQQGLTSALPLRRGLASALAAALVAAGFIVLSSFARRRR